MVRVAPTQLTGLFSYGILQFKSLQVGTPLLSQGLLHSLRQGEDLCEQ